jgi:magnesium-transporting ATPase (P-type)
LASVLNIRGLFGNWLIWLAVIALVIAQLGLTYWSPMQALFGTEGITGYTWQYIIAVAAGLFVLVEIEKYIIRSLNLIFLRTNNAK